MAVLILEVLAIFSNIALVTSALQLDFQVWEPDSDTPPSKSFDIWISDIPLLFVILLLLCVSRL